MMKLLLADLKKNSISSPMLKFVASLWVYCLEIQVLMSCCTYIMDSFPQCSNLLPWDCPYLQKNKEDHLWDNSSNSWNGLDQTNFSEMYKTHLLEQCPNNTFCAWRNCERTQISKILSAPKLDIPWINRTQINFFFTAWIKMS